MRRLRVWFIAFGLLALLAPPIPANAQGSIVARGSQATIEFPNRITFSVDLQSEADINSVVLEYGVDQLTCGKVIAKAFPDFTPGKTVHAEWAWEMKQSGSQPPGSKIWWHWQVTDAAGHELLTDQQTITWLDDTHHWQTVTGGLLNLHWYAGGNSFATELHDSAIRSLSDLEQSTGVKPDAPIDLYIYASSQDMRDAVLYEPGWTGGLAYPDHDIVIIGISADQLDWGKRTEAHELTHVLVGHLTFTCLGEVPTWLNEGLAVYGEGGPDDTALKQFDAAVKDNKLLSVRSISGAFSEDPAKADLSYSESYSLVKFLVAQYGQDKMLSLLRSLRDGATVDQALQSIYGFNIEGFEDAWRAAIGAQPRSGGNTTPTPTSTPTMIPTFVPISIAQTGPTVSPTRVRPTPTPQPIAQSQNPSPAAITNAPSINPEVLIGGALVVVLLIGIGLIVVARRQQRMKL